MDGEETMPSLRVTGVGSDGLNVRSGPSTSAAVVGSLADGTLVEAGGSLTPGGGHNWRHITSPRDGFVADEFLGPDNGPHGIFSAADLFELVRRHGAEPVLDRIMAGAAL